MSTYLYHKVKSIHDYERIALLTMRSHLTKCMIIHKQAYIYIYIYIYTHTYTYNMYNANMQSGKVKQTLPTS